MICITDRSGLRERWRGAVGPARVDRRLGQRLPLHVQGLGVRRREDGRRRRRRCPATGKGLVAVGRDSHLNSPLDKEADEIQKVQQFNNQIVAKFV
jgi:hypothetical protein